MFFRDNDVWRLNGSVTITKSFGDFRISAMTADPDILSINLTDVDGSLKAAGIDPNHHNQQRQSQDGQSGDAEEQDQQSQQHLQVPQDEFHGAGSGDHEEKFDAKYLVLSSDGLTDVFDLEDVGEFIEQWGEDQRYKKQQARQEALKEKKKAQGGEGEDVDVEEDEEILEDEDVLPVGIAYALAFDAVDARNSMDNVSVIVVRLK
jgi:serine/threonine protein phosphatase PrpC